jgi:hypothetical protein
MFKKMLLITFCATIFWALLGITIWALGFVINFPEAQFWALMCLLNFGPFFLGLQLVAGIGGACPLSEEKLRQLCHLCPCAGKYLPKELNFLLNGVIYSFCGSCLYAMGAGGALYGLGRYIMRGETNLSPLFIFLAILGGAMVIIGLQLLRHFTIDTIKAYEKAEAYDRITEEA